MNFSRATFDTTSRLTLSSVALAAILGAAALADASRPSAHDHDRAPHTGMGMDPFGHTRVLPKRDASADDLARADSLTTTLATAIAKYPTPESAVAAGYLTTGERVPVGALKHYVNYSAYAHSLHAFDPTRPMALLYRHVSNGWQLAGAMYGAAYPGSVGELDRRVPISLGHWHAHTSICQPNAGTPITAKSAEAFGFSGWIANAPECRRNNGTFIPVVYGWMVHVYPFEHELAARF